MSGTNWSRVLQLSVILDLGLSCMWLKHTDQGRFTKPTLMSHQLEIWKAASGLFSISNLGREKSSSRELEGEEWRAERIHWSAGTELMAWDLA